MRYFSYAEYDPYDLLADDTGGYTVTVSEEDILRVYWDHWYKSMCNKFGKTYVDQKHTKSDCINDFLVVHWAWEVKDIYGNPK